MSPEEALSGGVPPAAAPAAAEASSATAGEPPAGTEEVAPRRAPVWPVIPGAVFLYLGGMVLGGLLAALIVTLLAQPWGQPSSQGTPGEIFRRAMREPRALVLSLALGNAMVALFALAVGRASGQPWRQRLGLVPGRVPARDLPLLVLASIGALGIGIVMTMALQRIGLLSEMKGTRELARALMNATPAASIALVLSGSVLVGIAEELVFRGCLQRALLERWRPGSAIAVTTVVFAILHGTPGYVVFVLPISIFLCYLAWRADSILPGMVCHMSVNAIAQANIAINGRWLTRDGHGAAGAGLAGILDVSLVVSLLVVSAALVWFAVRRVERRVRASADASPTGGDPTAPLA